MDEFIVGNKRKIQDISKRDYAQDIEACIDDMRYINGKYVYGENCRNLFAKIIKNKESSGDLSHVITNNLAAFVNLFIIYDIPLDITMEFLQQNVDISFKRRAFEIQITKFRVGSIAGFINRIISGNCVVRNEICISKYLLSVSNYDYYTISTNLIGNYFKCNTNTLTIYTRNEIIKLFNAIAMNSELLKATCLTSIAKCVKNTEEFIKNCERLLQIGDITAMKIASTYELEIAMSSNNTLPKDWALVEQIPSKSLKYESKIDAHDMPKSLMIATFYNKMLNHVVEYTLLRRLCDNGISYFKKTTDYICTRVIRNTICGITIANTHQIEGHERAPHIYCGVYHKCTTKNACLIHHKISDNIRELAILISRLLEQNSTIFEKIWEAATKLLNIDYNDSCVTHLLYENISPETFAIFQYYLSVSSKQNRVLIIKKMIIPLVSVGDYFARYCAKNGELLLRRTLNGDVEWKTEYEIGAPIPHYFDNFHALLLECVRDSPLITQDTINLKKKLRTNGFCDYCPNTEITSRIKNNWLE